MRSRRKRSKTIGRTTSHHPQSNRSTLYVFVQRGERMDDDAPWIEPRRPSHVRAAAARDAPGRSRMKGTERGREREREREKEREKERERERERETKRERERKRGRERERETKSERED